MAGTHAALEFSKGNEVVTAARSGSVDMRIDASDFVALEGALSKVGPDVVVNAIKPPIPADKMESEKEIARRINVEVASQLAVCQEKFGYKLVHISTDWVYEGKEGVCYDEASLPCPLNYYAQNKLEAEERVLGFSPSSLILRSEGIFGLDARGANIYMRLKDASRTGAGIQVASDQFSQPICGAELARIMRILVERGASGVFNVVGPQYVSRMEFAIMVCKEFGFNAKLVPFSIKGRAMAVPAFLKVGIGKVQAVAGSIKNLEGQFEDLRGIEAEHGG